MKTLHTTSGLAVALIAAAGLFSTSASASAAARADTPSAASRSVAVSYAHVDLGKPSAVDALYRQLARTAERVCGSYEPRNLRERDDWRRCREAAMSEAIAQLVEARISALHDKVRVAIPVSLVSLPVHL